MGFWARAGHSSDGELVDTVRMKLHDPLAVCTPTRPLANPRFVQPHVTEAMSVVVDVGLISGKTISVEAKLDEIVATLMRRAHTALAVGKGRLLDSSGGLLDNEHTVKQAKLETGTSLTLQLQAAGAVFAAILTDGSVVKSSRAEYGGDSRAVQDQLKAVQQIQASSGALQLS